MVLQSLELIIQFGVFVRIGWYCGEFLGRHRDLCWLIGRVESAT